MKLEINSNELITLLQPLEVVINPSHVVPIFQCVNLQITGKKIIATVDNQEVRCESSLKIKTDFKANICIEFLMLNSSLKSLKGLDLKIEITDKQMKMNHKSGGFSIPLEDASAYPEAKTEQLTSTATLKTEHLKEALKVGVRFLLDSNMEAVSNLFLEIGKKKTIVRATNKVSLYTNEIKGGGDKAKLLVSGKSASIINSLLESNEEFTEVKYNDSLVYFDFGDKQVTAVMQNGEFPLEMFNQIMSSIDGAETLEMKDKSLLASSIKRVSTLTMKEKYSIVKFDFKDGNLNLSHENEGASTKAQENLKVKFGDNKVIGFNAKIISEVLQVFEKDAEFSINSRNCFCIKTKRTSGLLAPVNLGGNNE